MKSSKGQPIAVDIVLLPDPVVRDAAIELNRYLVEQHNSAIRLDRDHCLPHVSLAMGCLTPRDLETVTRQLTKLATSHPVSPYPIRGIVTRESGSFAITSSLELERTDALQNLHEAVVQTALPFFTHSPSPAMLAGEKPIAESTLRWIADYAQTSSFERFWPHITLGYGDAGNKQAPKILRSTQLAVCHLGNHCTCREVLALIELN